MVVSYKYLSVGSSRGVALDPTWELHYSTIQG